MANEQFIKFDQFWCFARLLQYPVGGDALADYHFMSSQPTVLVQCHGPIGKQVR